MPNQKYKEFLTKITTEDIINKIELDENFSSAMVAKLKKAYEPLRGKKIAPEPLMKIFDKIDSNKDALITLYKADIPFVSTLAGSRLSMKHNLSPMDIKRIISKEEVKEDAPTNSVSSGGVDMAPNAGHPNIMKKHMRRNKKDQKDLTKKISNMVKENYDNNNNILKGVNQTLDKLEDKIDEISGIDTKIVFEEKKDYKTFSEKFKVGK